MSIFGWMLLLVGIVYGGLTAIGGIIQLKQRKIKLWASLSMAVGGVFIIFLTCFNLILVKGKIFMLIGALALIPAAAVNNGFVMHGRINLKHQGIRLGISLLIIVLFLIK